MLTAGAESLLFCNACKFSNSVFLEATNYEVIRNILLPETV